ncbi:ras guanine nucleotide exchange factor domain-containing protein [Amylostereum chailletii]|nr:ras guanine nucleotide exchange factor domain-containing protein [Amylostereum chailletii]
METSQTSKDIRYRYVFLASYRLFTTSEQLFTILRKHFDAMDGEDRENLATTRYAILLLIKTWLQLGYEDMNVKVLDAIGTFSRAINESQTMMTLTRDISAVVTQKILNIDVPHPTSSLRISANVLLPKASDILPEELAIAFTILKGHIFSQVTHFDCITHLQQHSEVKRIQRCTTMYNKIVNWVKKSILRPESIDARADVYKFFVNTAEESQKLHNLSSLSAILTALNSANIKHLVLTREIRLVKAEKHAMHRMYKILDPTRNYRAYKGVLRQYSETVPWLGKSLSDSW